MYSHFYHPAAFMTPFYANSLPPPVFGTVGPYNPYHVPINSGSQYLSPWSAQLPVYTTARPDHQVGQTPFSFSSHNSSTSIQRQNAPIYNSTNLTPGSTPPQGWDGKYPTVGDVVAEPSWNMHDADPRIMRAPAPVRSVLPKLLRGKTHGAHESRENLPMDGLLRHFVNQNNPLQHDTYLNGKCVLTQANAGYSDDVSDCSGDDDDV